MIYTELTRAAMRLAYDAHHGQTDRNGTPYIYHPVAVAEQMRTEEEILVALLHDVVEDTDVTADDLEACGFPPAVLEALRLLTHKSGEGYEDYLRQVRENPLALKVKLADLAHNSQPDRLACLSEETRTRLRKKYAGALRVLTSRSENEE